MSGGNEEMNARILGAAGRRRVARVVPEIPEAHRAINDAILRAAGRAPREPDPASTISEDDDSFSREAKTLGIASDLVDLARAVVPNADELAGAALTSALTKAIGERPSLAPDFQARMETRLDGLDGGAGRGSRREPEESPSTKMNRLIRQKTGRMPLDVPRAPNGLPLQDG